VVFGGVIGLVGFRNLVTAYSSGVEIAMCLIFFSQAILTCFLTETREIELEDFILTQEISSPMI